MADNHRRAAHRRTERVFQLGVRAVRARAGCAHAVRLQFADFALHLLRRSGLHVANQRLRVLRVGVNALSNSRYVSYRIIYRFVDTGDVIGTAYVVLDITTMGMGLPEEPFAVQVRQNVPASYAVMEALEEWGYEYEYSGSPDVGFYLRRISRAGFMDYPDIPENLWAKILRDGLNLTGQHDNDSLGEFDYTQGSGWMYSIGGQTYAGKGLSNYFLSSGDTLYLRFTLAYGKDIGGYDATGGNYGALSTYCGRWINGQYIDEHRWGQPQQTTAPDCTHPGQAAVTCQVCGDVGRTQEIPALGHDFQETERRDGVIIYTCSRCGERKEEPIP